MIKEIDRLIGVHNLILQRRKGTPKQIASYMSMSRACFYRYLEKLTNLGADIKY